MLNFTYRTFINENKIKNKLIVSNQEFTEPTAIVVDELEARDITVSSTTALIAKNMNLHNINLNNSTLNIVQGYSDNEKAKIARDLMNVLGDCIRKSLLTSFPLSSEVYLQIGQVIICTIFTPDEDGYTKVNKEELKNYTGSPGSTLMFFNLTDQTLDQAMEDTEQFLANPKENHKIIETKPNECHLSIAP